MNANPARKLLSAVVIGCLSAGCLWTAGAPAAGESIELTVAAGQHDRTNTPVCVLVDVPDKVKAVMLTGSEGKQLPGQLTAPGLLNDSAQGKRELHFVLPSLAAGQSATFSAAFSEDAPKEATFSWQNTPEEYAELSCAGRPVVRYMCQPPDPENVEETCKVFHHL